MLTCGNIEMGELYPPVTKDTKNRRIHYVHTKIPYDMIH